MKLIFLCLFARLNNNVAVDLNGKEIDLRICFCLFAGKLTLSAADFKVNGVFIAEDFFVIYQLFFNEGVAVFIVAAVNVSEIKDIFAAAFKALFKVLFSSHSHIEILPLSIVHKVYHKSEHFQEVKQ